MSTPAILFTIDYELFLGARSGSVSQCLLKPTALLLDMLEGHGIRAVFFVDATYLVALERGARNHASLERDLADVRAQLGDALRRGHELFLHIHPHWSDAEFDASRGDWALRDTRYYRFAALDDDARRRIFDDSLNALRKTAHDVDPDYVISGFRAGGWSIQPFDAIRPHFEREGIEYDFSVVPGLASETSAQAFDFRSAPRKPWYRFSSEVCAEDPNGPFVELPISTLWIGGPHRLFDWAARWVRWRTERGRSFGDGVGVVPEPGPAREPVDEGDGAIMAAAERVNGATRSVFLAEARRAGWLHLISHPKMLSHAALGSLDRLFGSIPHADSERRSFPAIAEEIRSTGTPALS